MLLRPAIFLLLLINVGGMAAQPSGSRTKPQSQSPAAVMSYTGGLADTCLNKTFSVMFWGIQDSAITRAPASYSAHINTLLQSWNLNFKRICVSFVNCSTAIIPHYEFGRWKYRKTDPGVLKSYYKENVINVYLPEEIADFAGLEYGAYAYASLVAGVQNKPVPMGAVEGTIAAIVINTGLQQPAPPPAALVWPSTYTVDAMHALGHFFGLPDTFAEVSTTSATPTSTNTQVISTEFVDGSNGHLNGDLFSDTDADCYPAYGTGKSTSPCDFAYDVLDGKGQQYIPPVDNFMSKWPCACRFTQQQYNYMVWYIMQKRMHLH